MRHRNDLETGCLLWPELLSAVLRAPSPPVGTRGYGYSEGSAESYAVWYVDDLTLVSDHPLAPGLSSIFPPHPETLFLSRLIQKGHAGARFLDLGCGPGLIAVTAARQGWATTAADVNPDAVGLTRANASLNGVPVEAVVSDLGAGLAGVRFDFCIANLPFEPVPPGSRCFLHSDGGPFGDAVIRRLLGQAESILADGGQMLIPAFSLVRGGPSLLEEALDEVTASGMHAGLVRLSQPIDVRLLLGRYSHASSRRGYEHLAAKGYRSFVVEIGAIRRLRTPTKEARHLFRFDRIVADETWLSPLGVGGIAKVVEHS